MRKKDKAEKLQALYTVKRTGRIHFTSFAIDNSISREPSHSSDWPRTSFTLDRYRLNPVIPFSVIARSPHFWPLSKLTRERYTPR